MKKILGRFINCKYFEHQQFVLFYLSNHELDPISLYNYLNYVISVRTLSWVDVFIETFASALSVVCSCTGVLGDPPQWGLPRNGSIRRETTFLRKICVKAEESALCWPVLSSQPWNLTIGDLWEADFCFWAGELKSESWKCQTEVCLYVVW